MSQGVVGRPERGRGPTSWENISPWLTPQFQDLASFHDFFGLPQVGKGCLVHCTEIQLRG